MFFLKLTNTSKVIYQQKWLMMFECGHNMALLFYVWFVMGQKDERI
jgi:hypothetical protein